MRWSLLGAFALSTCVYANSRSANATVDTLSSYCDAQLASFTQTYQSTQLATSRWTYYEGFGPTDSQGILTGSVTSQTYWTSTFLYTQYAIRAYTPKPPCCSSCYLTAGTIDFYFWPDQATPTAPASGQATTSVDSDGFTFTSPSVYMAFSSLAANNRCGPVGNVWTNTTIAFHPTEITTVRPVTTLTVISTPTVEAGITYNYIVTALTTRPPPRRIDYNEIGQNCSTITGYVYWPDNPLNADNANYVDDPCHPVIQLPDRLLTMQPAWAEAKCGMPPGTSGAYDPPRVLTPLVTATEVAEPTPKWEKMKATQTASPASSITTGATSTTLPVTSGVSALPDIVSEASSETETGAENTGASSQGIEAGSTQQVLPQQTQQTRQQQGSTQDSTSGASSSDAATSPQHTGMGAAIMAGLDSGSDTRAKYAGSSNAHGVSGTEGSSTNDASVQGSVEDQTTGSPECQTTGSPEGQTTGSPEDQTTASAAKPSGSKAATRGSSATSSTFTTGSDGTSPSSTTAAASAAATTQSSGVRMYTGLRMELLSLVIGLFGISLL